MTTEGSPPESSRGEEPDLARTLVAQLRAASRFRPGPRKRARRGGGGQPGSFSGPHPDDRDPQPVGDTLDRLITERGWSQPLAVGGVEGRWGGIVGDEVAAHCWPELYEAGRLTVRTDSTAWATQIRLLAPTLLARLNDDLGAGTVTHLAVLSPQGPSWRKGKLRVKGRGPRDTYG